MPNDSLLSRSLSAGFATVIVCAGCSSSNETKVDLNQFSNTIDTSAGASTPRVVYAPIPRTTIEPETLVIKSLETTGHAGTPAPFQHEHSSANAAVYDAKIGDINGKPIIASRFLEDLMPRLRAEAEKTGVENRAAWRSEAGKIIARKLDGLIRDEVLYREARARLPESSQQGLFHFVDRIRDNLIRQSDGSQSLAEQRILEEENQTMDEFLESVEKQIIIKEILDIAAEDYAPVSWLDIQNEYQRQFKYFNPDPVVLFRIINATGPEAVEIINGRLDSGQEFKQIAGDSSLNTFAPERQGLFNETGTTIEVPLAEATLIADPDLNEAVVKLAEGQWAGPITRSNGRQSFVYLDRLVQESSTLEEEHVQISLERYLKQRRSDQALESFVSRLRERANLGSSRFNELVVELLQVAETRVYGSEPAPNN
jgi:hypothetical protein